MRRTALVLVSLLTFASNAFAKEVWLSVVGSVNGSSVFRTDTRILNPSTTKDISIDAYFFINGNQTNATPQKKTITVTKRQMLVLDDVVSALFTTSGLGAIRLVSDDDFIATTRIYADKGASGTLGQFVPGLDISFAKKTGAILQLRNSGPTFHTNIGAVNPTSATANIVWRLYDKNNALVGSGKNETMPPFSVISPQVMANYFNAGSADLSEAWVSFSSDQPIFAYGTVSDDRTADPTLIPASEDSGMAALTQPTAKAFDVTLRTSTITFNPLPSNLKLGDTVLLHIHGNDTNHGFQLVSPTSKVVIEGFLVDPGTTADRTFTVTEEGTFSYFCINTSCSTGHNQMFGSFVVGKDTGDDPGHGY
jgi:plastocyanin